MEGKSFYGKTTSPKVIAEASLAYSFSFDLQRFENVWSIGSGENAGKYIYGEGDNSVASLFADTSGNVWSLGGGSGTTTIKLDFTAGTTGKTDANASILGGDINTSISSANSTITSLTAKDLTSPFFFNLGTNSKLASVIGASGQANTIKGGTGPIYIQGGSQNDSLIAGTNASTLFGGAGNDSLVGGNGKDYFVYGGSGIDSIFNYTTGQDFISLTGSAALPGVASVKTATGSDALILDFGTNNSLAVVGASVTTATVGLIKGTNTYYYNKDYIQLDKNVSLTSDVTNFSAFNTGNNVGSIDATGVTNTDGVWINSYGNSVIGSENAGTSVFGGAGNDFVSLAGSTQDVFIYGGGNDTIQNIGANNSFVSLGTRNYGALITDGTKLTSLDNQNGFVLKFDDNNSLTFKEPKGAVSIAAFSALDNATLQYTPTAISLAGATNGSSITLGSSYVNENGNFEDSGYSVISAAAVSVSNGSFAVSGNTDGANLIWGSDKQVTSILGGSGNDTLYAGKAGASLVGNGGADLLIGNTSGEDTFIYSGNGDATIRNYTYGTDLVSLGGGALPTTDVTRFKLESGKSNFRISLGASNQTASILTFESANTVEAVSLGTSDSLDTYHYEHDRVIVNKSRVTLGTEYTSKNFNANADNFIDSGYALASIDASHVTVGNGINITARAGENNSVIGAKYGGRIIGSEYADYLQSGVTLAANEGGSLYSSTIDAGAVGSGANADSLVGGTGKDWFIYRGGQASIGSYTKGSDIIQVIGGNDGFNMIGEDAPTFASMPTASNDLVLDFGSGASLSIAGGASSENVVTFRNGSHTLEYGAGAVSIDNTSVILTKDYKVGEPGYIATGKINIVDASAVTSGVVSLGANSIGTHLIGSATLGNSLVGGSGNDYLTGGGKADVFEYNGGKDTVSNYSFSEADSLVAADSFISDIKSGKVSGSRLIFTGTNKNNVLTFLSDDDAIEKVSLGGGGYLTKDGVVKLGESGDSLKLFSNARGRIELNTAPYSVESANAITSVNAAAVAQGVTLVAGSLNAASAYILPGNKKRDRFEYAGGKVSISGYESGKDQLNLGIGTVSGFEISGNNVLISLNGSTNDVVSILGSNSNKAKDMNFLIHQSTDGTSTYRKMAFNQSGILTNKASKPTTVTVLSGADSLNANANELGGGTIKKIYAVAGLSSISIEAGDKNNTTIDISAAGADMSVYGGKKNDKITGSTDYGDMFVYKTDNSGVGGKDVITNFDYGKDMVSLGANPDASLSGAKISKGSKSVMFKFANSKNSLNLKSSDAITEVTVMGGSAATNNRYTFGKNAFSTNGGETVSLTSNFSGNFDISKTKIGDNSATNIDGSKVTKAFTFKGTTSGETVSGGTNKTTFRGGGGTDKFIGGSGKDVFFYAKGEQGTTEIADFDYKNDKIKIASGTLKEISSIEGGGVQLAMKDNSGNSIGFYQITSAKNYKSDIAANKPGASTVFKANNTYYWFAPEKITEEVTVEGGDKQTVTLASAGDLVTSDTRVSASKVSSSYDVIELNYTTNLVKAGVAVASANAKLPNE